MAQGMARVPARGAGGSAGSVSVVLCLDLISLLGNMPVHLGDLASWEGC